MTQHWKYSYQKLSYLSIKIIIITIASCLTLYCMDGFTGLGLLHRRTAMHLKVYIYFPAWTWLITIFCSEFSVSLFEKSYFSIVQHKSPFGPWLHPNLKPRSHHWVMGFSSLNKKIRSLSSSIIGTKQPWLFFNVCKTNGFNFKNNLHLSSVGFPSIWN